MRGALQRLSDPYREVVVLRHYEGLKFREIADVLGIPEGTVKSRMTEALVQLTKLLRPALADDSAATRPRVVPIRLPDPTRSTPEQLMI